MTSILILARHYPPAVSGGAKRPYLLARALRRRGMSVRICAPSLPDGETGWALAHPHRDPEPSALPPRLSLRAIMRNWLLWPDPDIRWCRRAAARVIDSGWRPDWVISTSPPESIHVAGARIARVTGARWMADLRDLWLERPHRHERLQLHRKFGEAFIARQLLGSADIVTAVDGVVAEEARRFGARNVHVLQHFVASDRPAPATLEAGALNIVHAGSVSLSDPDASIDQMLQPFEAALEKNPALVLHMAGRLTVPESRSILASRAASRIRIHGVLSLEAAGSLVAGADALIFVASQKMHVPPSKLADYLMSDVPIIACGAGPWRADARIPEGEPAGIMAALRRGQKRNVDCPRPMLEDEAAARIAGWFAALDEQTGPVSPLPGRSAGGRPHREDADRL
jgi:glycosyltransferase involved in cell wall biosynthesis